MNKFKNTTFLITMQQPTTINYWKQYHDALHSDAAKACKARIEAALNICQSAFYRKIKDPQRYLSPSDRSSGRVLPKNWPLQKCIN
jgi:hypothetical protein